jgi:biotin-(acetyl-CoA carboxylase) ligase
VEFGIAVPRRYVAARFLSRLQNFCELFEAGENETILEKYKAASSIWKGVPIWVIDGNSRKPAVTCGLSRTGGLRVRMDSGEEETLLAAEVSVRRQF